MRSRRSSGGRESRSRTTDRRRTPTDRGGADGNDDAEHPQAEREQPHRSHLRAGRRPRRRRGRRVGVDDEPRIPREVPGAPHADAGGGGPPARLPRGELRDHGLPLQQARPHPVLPLGSGGAGDGRQRDVLLDRHALSADHARDLPRARLRAVPGRGRLLGRRRRDEGEGGGRMQRPRSPSRSTSTARSSSTASSSSAATRRRSPTSAWPRRSSSCARSTTSSRPGPRSTCLEWRRRSATHTRSRPQTSVATSTT